MVQLTNAIDNLETKIGTMKSEISTEVTASVSSTLLPDLRKMLLEMMAKPMVGDLSLTTTPGASDAIPGITIPIEDSIAKAIAEAKAKAEAVAKADADAKARDSESGTHTTPITENGSGVNSKVLPPQNYDSIHPIVQMPHILNVGSPPMLNTNDFSLWKFLMESHISSSCNALWRSVLYGFRPYDPRNLTPKEVVECQLNATALNIIQKALPLELLAHIRSCNTAKEAWDSLNILFEGNSSIQQSKYDLALDQADMFVMQEDESPEDLYRRLTALAIQLRYFGREEIIDDWVKRKFVKAITPFEKTLATTIRARPDFGTLSSISVLSEFIAIAMMHKNADNALARSRGMSKSPNLALKSKVVIQEKAHEEFDGDSDEDDIKAGLHEVLGLAANAYWKKRANNKKPSNSRSPSKDTKQRFERARTYYNCGSVNHFIAECPYENREDNGGKLIR